MLMANAHVLGEKLGRILIQLPPSLSFDPDLAASFFQSVRDRHTGPLVCEPRHPSWFTEDANELLKGSRVGRVAADPAIVPAAAEPGGRMDLVYYRLHGSPRKYFSGYEKESISRLADAARKVRGDVWCIFDNTAGGAAAGNALALMRALQSPSTVSTPSTSNRNPRAPARE